MESVDQDLKMKFLELEIYCSFKQQQESTGAGVVVDKIDW